MDSYYFADYRLLTDIDFGQWEGSDFIREFAMPMAYSDTFTLHCIVEKEIGARVRESLNLPLLLQTNIYSLHRLPDSGCAFVKPGTEQSMGCVLTSSPDYSEMTLHTEYRSLWSERLGRMRLPSLPFSSVIRCCVEAGMGLRVGVPMHASLVEKDGEGVLFLGPSGMGKSTQARLWKSALDADFISGDRPGLRLLDGRWYAYGMPWDGKDGIRRQRGVPVRGLVVLNQAKDNSICRISAMEAKSVLFNQAIIPVWDDKALDGMMPLISRLSTDLPFYRLDCLPDAAAAELTYKTLFRQDS